MIALQPMEHNPETGEHLDLINAYAQHDDESDEWQIKCIAISGNNVASQRQQISPPRPVATATTTTTKLANASSVQRNEKNERQQKLLSSRQRQRQPAENYFGSTPSSSEVAVGQERRQPSNGQISASCQQAASVKNFDSAMNRSNPYTRLLSSWKIYLSLVVSVGRELKKEKNYVKTI